MVPETFAPVILERRAAQLAKATGRPHRSIHAPTEEKSLKATLLVSLGRPLELLFCEKIVSFFAIYTALICESRVTRLEYLSIKRLTRPSRCRRPPIRLFRRLSLHLPRPTRLEYWVGKSAVYRHRSRPAPGHRPQHDPQQNVRRQCEGGRRPPAAARGAAAAVLCRRNRLLRRSPHAGVHGRQGDPLDRPRYRRRPLRFWFVRAAVSCRRPCISDATG